MKRKIAILLAVCMIFTMMPSMAFANSANNYKPAKYTPNAATLQKNDEARSKLAAFTENIDVDVDVETATTGESKDLEEPDVDEVCVKEVSELKKAEAGKASKATNWIVELNGYVYNSLQYAVNDAYDGDTITLIDDVSLQGAIISEKDINIDLNGYYIGAAYSDFVVGIYDADVNIYNKAPEYGGSIINVGTGYAVAVLGDSYLYIEDTAIMTDADDSVGIAVGTGSYAYIDNGSFLNGSVLDSYASDVVGVFVSDDAYAIISDSEVVFDEGVAVLCGDGNFTSLYGNNFFWVEEGIGVFNNGGFVEVDGGHYLAESPFVNYTGTATLWYGLFESELYDVAAIDSGGSNNGTGITIATDSNVRPSDWRTVNRDIIGVYYNLAKPANTKVNLNTGFRQIKATWNAVPDADGYAVYYKKGTGNYIFWGRTTNKYATIKNLTAGCKYTVKVVPYDKMVGEYSDIIGQSAKFSTAYTYTLKKVNLNSFQRSNGKVKVRWYNINGETGYQISKSTSSTGTNIVATVVNANATYKLINATKGKNYYYKVRAYKTVNGKKIFGPWSAAKKFKR